MPLWEGVSGLSWKWWLSFPDIMILLALVKASVSFGIRPSWYKDHMFRCDAASMLAKSAWAVLSPGSEMNTSISRSRLPIYSLVKFLMPSPPFFSDMKFCVWRRKSSISFCVDKRWAGVYLSFCIGSGTYLHIVERMWLLGKLWVFFAISPISGTFYLSFTLYRQSDPIVHSMWFLGTWMGKGCLLYVDLRLFEHLLGHRSILVGLHCFFWLL